MAEPLECRRCGACCGPRYDEETHVDLDRADLRRLSPRFRRLHVLQPSCESAGSIRTKRNHNGVVCAALRGSVGSRVSCAIYDRRPKGCRAYRPGSRDCLETRRRLEIDT